MQANDNQWERLPFQVERQIRPHVCWAAIASAVSRFYSPDNYLTQEELIEQAFGQGANKFWYPEAALKLAGNYREKCARPLTFAELSAEIHNWRVVVVRIWWEFGGGHLVAIAGVSQQAELAVEDPMNGPSICPYDVFIQKYLGAGRWSHSYLTQPPI